MDPVDTHKHIRRLHVYILVLTIAVFAMVWLVFKDQLPGAKKEGPSPTVSKVKKENKGAMALQNKSNSRTAPLNGSLVVQVTADSDAEDIVGFDVLLGYDSDAFDVTSVTTPLTGFKAVSTEADTYMAVLGYQPPQNTNRNIFKNTVILEVTLTPKLAGDYEFSILPKAGKETSKLLTTQTNILLPKVEGLKVSVQ